MLARLMAASCRLCQSNPSLKVNTVCALSVSFHDRVISKPLRWLTRNARPEGWTGLRRLGLGSGFFRDDQDLALVHDGSQIEAVLGLVHDAADLRVGQEVTQLVLHRRDGLAAEAVVPAGEGCSP